MLWISRWFIFLTGTNSYQFKPCLYLHALFFTVTVWYFKHKYFTHHFGILQYFNANLFIVNFGCQRLLHPGRSSKADRIFGHLHWEALKFHTNQKEWTLFKFRGYWIGWWAGTFGYIKDRYVGEEETDSFVVDFLIDVQELREAVVDKKGKVVENKWHVLNSVAIYNFSKLALITIHMSREGCGKFFLVTDWGWEPDCHFMPFISFLNGAVEAFARKVEKK